MAALNLHFTSSKYWHLAHLAAPKCQVANFSTNFCPEVPVPDLQVQGHLIGRWGEQWNSGSRNFTKELGLKLAKPLSFVNYRYKPFFFHIFLFFHILWIIYNIYKYPKQKHLGKHVFHPFGFPTGCETQFPTARKFPAVHHLDVSRNRTYYFLYWTSSSNPICVITGRYTIICFSLLLMLIRSSGKKYNIISLFDGSRLRLWVS